MVKLGYWQLDRAEQKQRWQQQLEHRINASPLNLSQLQRQLQNEDNPSGFRADITGTAIDKVLLLDNQVVKGQVGYLAYQPLQLTTQSPWLLIELGFIATGAERAILPQIPRMQGHYHLTGKLYRREANPLSKDLLPEPGWPSRIQNLHFKQLAELMGHDVLPVVLQPDTIPSINLPRPWQPIPMPSERHLGYALQWFSLAGALALLSTLFAIRQIKSRVQPPT